MLKGHVFAKQLFGNPIFALFINTFLNGRNGVSDNYKNGMNITYSNNTLTVDSGAVCIQGRFLEEDTSSSISAGTDTAFCKLVIEIDLDKENTESDFKQGTYKIVKSAISYPALTQTNIVKNNSGIYQYELARFKTNVNGITDFQDMRTFLNFQSIYDALEKEYKTVLNELQDELANVKDGSDYLLKSAGGTVEGKIIANGGVEGVCSQVDTKILEGQIIISNGMGYANINYPTGFNKNNTCVCSLYNVNLANGSREFGNSNNVKLSGALLDNNIRVEANLDVSTMVNTIGYELVLIKK